MTYLDGFEQSIVQILAMTHRAVFLHITDVHLASEGTSFPRGDQKVKIPGIAQDTREGVLEQLLRRVAERLTSDQHHLDGVLFSGDAQDRGRPGGHRILLDLLLHYLGPLGIKVGNIVATPGNHDIPRDSDPGSEARYRSFTEVWTRAGCVVPWLDGIPGPSPESHRLLDSERRWVVYPVNSCNWSHVNLELEEPLKSQWDRIPKLLAGEDADSEEKIRSQLQGLTRYDMARVSNEQMEALRRIVSMTPQPADGRQVRIAMLHHHLRAPSLREELKPFSDISNLEQFRAFLASNKIGVIIHGHKHEPAAQFEQFSSDQGDEPRMLVISGATFEVRQEADAVRLITIEGLPFAPTVTIEPICLPRAGVESTRAVPIVKRLWSTVAVPGGPVVIQGSNLDEVYDRACAAAEGEAAGGTLIVHLDLKPDSAGLLPLPTRYPTETLDDGERQQWLKELVAWWQRDRSSLERRIPYLHGSRLRRFGGKIDQVKRVIELLRVKATTRALAVLVDPFCDFREGSGPEEFASFCLVEFKRRDCLPARPVIDAIAFYRAQEFARWWPINVAELHFLLIEISGALNFQVGRITTIAADARTISRSPTQVAMPIIDRWLDQAPERFHLLANALVQGTVSVGRQSDALRDWERSLSDLLLAASEYNSDGVPISIDGLYTLAAYLEATADGQHDVVEMVRKLRHLANANASYEQGQRGVSEFNLWAPSAQGLVKDLQAMSRKRIKAEA